MIPEIRLYQAELELKIKSLWSSGLTNILAVLPTGGGKTVIFSKIIKDHTGAACAIAHRQELVSQISMTLASFGVVHKIIGQRKVVNKIVARQIKKYGRSFYNPNSKTAVAGVDTLIRREKQLGSWLSEVTLIVQDEAHHVLKNNKWGKAAAMFPNAKGLGVTATPTRADGNGLGRHHDGIYDALALGPSMRDLINMGYLVDYRVYSPKSNLDLSVVDISKKTGDFNNIQVREAVAKSSLVFTDDGKSRVIGDIVNFYMTRLQNKRSVVFVPDVKTAHEIARQFQLMGVNAVALDANTDDDIRASAISDMEKDIVKVLVNVDLFSEGFDLPAIDAVQDGYPTHSFSRYAQRFGRMLRIMAGKEFGIYVDHADNITRNNGLPDRKRTWSLDRRDKRSWGSQDVMPTRTCLNEWCVGTFDKYLKICPYCNTPVPPPIQRDGPEFVDGDLFELDAETLAKLRGEVDEMNKPIDDQILEYRRQLQLKNTPKNWEWSHVKNFAAKIESNQQQQNTLRNAMAWWAGYRRSEGKTDAEIFRMFYNIFKIDWLTAQTLPNKDAEKLSTRIEKVIT